MSARTRGPCQPPGVWAGPWDRVGRSSASNPAHTRTLLQGTGAETAVAVTGEGVVTD